MTTQVLSKRIDVDTHFYPPVDDKSLRAYLPRGLVSQAADMLVRDAIRAAEPERVAAATTGASPPSRRSANPHSDPDARAAALEATGFDMQVLIPDGLFANLYGASPFRWRLVPARSAPRCAVSIMTQRRTLSDAIRIALLARSLSPLTTSRLRFWRRNGRCGSLACGPS